MTDNIIDNTLQMAIEIFDGVILDDDELHDYIEKWNKKIIDEYLTRFEKWQNKGGQYA